ncbi:hypothetical protein [Paracraurococcus lichenis]|uniref:Uncharacterized protein n=1 Tax=Paracraurococcus lichenis TaxID=3064888 RepID=A0ABT9DVU9_9PROT|nr:hypothetical protein [Paracraurococcus sp. LOR1-02]MDO9708029.1 hypothetical protein [Paracraurococcus sp. LOR1-02]
MSETSKDTTGAAPPAPRNSPLDPPAPRRLDPAAVTIGIGGVVLLLAVWWLLNTPRATNDAAVDPARVSQLEQRLASLEGVRGEVGTLTGRLNALSGVEPRMQALENRPAPAIPDIRPVESQLNSLNERSAANDRRIAALEGRPALDPTAFVPRGSLESLTGRLDQLDAAVTKRLQEATAADQQREQAAAQTMERRLQELAQAMDRRLQEFARADEQQEQAAAQVVERTLQEFARAVEQRDQAMTRRLQELTQADEQREQAAAQAVDRKLAEAARTDEQREQAARQAVDRALQDAVRADEQREQQAAQRLAALEAQVNQKLAALDQAQQALRAGIARNARLTALDRVRAALAAGQPLGEGLGGIDQPPAALTRFAQSAPPTLAALQQGFEDAARAARDAAVPAAQGGKADPVDSALARVGSLLTVRRGDQVLWGDSIEPDLERARRALETGDLEMSLQHVGKLPPSAQTAMAPWVDQVKAVIAARAALRQMAAG